MRETLKKLKTKIEANTTISSIVVLLVMLIYLAWFDKIVNPTGLVFEQLRVFNIILLWSFSTKMILTFFMKIPVNEKGMKVENRFAMLRSQGFSIMETKCIVGNEIIQENSKHKKISNRESTVRISIAIILTGLWVLGVL